MKEQPCANRRDWSIWWCELYDSRIHGCPACWVSRFFYTILVIAPLLFLLTRRTP